MSDHIPSEESTKQKSTEEEIFGDAPPSATPASTEPLLPEKSTGKKPNWLLILCILAVAGAVWFVMSDSKPSKGGAKAKAKVAAGKTGGKATDDGKESGTVPVKAGSLTNSDNRMPSEYERTEQLEKTKIDVHAAAKKNAKTETERHYRPASETDSTSGTEVIAEVSSEPTGPKYFAVMNYLGDIGNRATTFDGLAVGEKISEKTRGAAAQPKSDQAAIQDLLNSVMGRPTPPKAAVPASTLHPTGQDVSAATLSRAAKMIGGGSGSSSNGKLEQAVPTAKRSVGLETYAKREGFLPRFSLIPCVLTNPVVIRGGQITMMGIVTENVVFDGQIVLRAGNMIYGTATTTDEAGFVRASPEWTLVWSAGPKKGMELNVPAEIKHKDMSHDKKTVGAHNLEDGVQGKILESDAKYWAGILALDFAKGFGETSKEKVQSLTGSADTNSLQNAGISGAQRSADRISDYLTKRWESFKTPVQLDVGTQFYLLTTRAITTEAATVSLLDAPIGNT